MLKVLSLGLSLFLSFNTATSVLTTVSNQESSNPTTIITEASNSTINVSDSELDNYLINANYPKDFISSLHKEQKLTIYKDKLTFGGIETVYAIFTEDVQIPVVKNASGAFTLKNITDQSKLDTLLKDTKTVQKILTENNSNIELQNDSSLNLLNSNTKIGLAALTNWSSSVASSTPSYLSNGKARVYLTYTWNWNYAPAVTLEDVMAMAWTDDWDCEPSTVFYHYGASGKHSVYGTDSYASTGYKYTSYSPGAGVGVEYDIVGYWNKKNSSGILVTYTPTKHYGQFSTYISKYRAYSGLTEQTSVVGQYFHETFSANPSISFSYPPSISVTPTARFDASSETGRTFSWSN